MGLNSHSSIKDSTVDVELESEINLIYIFYSIYNIYSSKFIYTCTFFIEFVCVCVFLCFCLLIKFYVNCLVLFVFDLCKLLRVYNSHRNSHTLVGLA